MVIHTIQQTRFPRIMFKLCIMMFLVLMLIFPTAALTGAKRGLLLWFNTVLPTLLPFIIVSTLLIKLRITDYLCRILHPVLGCIFRVSTNCCYPIVIGFLAGFPMGAKTCSDLVKEKKISLKEGNFLAGMCNNASPMFLLSYIAISELNLPQYKMVFLLIIYFSSIIATMIYRIITSASPINSSSYGNPIIAKPLSFSNKENGQTPSCYYLTTQSSTINPIKEATTATLHSPIAADRSVPLTKQSHFDFAIVDQSILSGFEVITKVGGYIILFSILSQIVLSLPKLNLLLQSVIVGILELTSGIDTIAKGSLDQAIKIVLILTITSFGGFSSLAQTKSVFEDSGLSTRIYLQIKIISAVITFVLALLYVKLILHL